MINSVVLVGRAGGDPSVKTFNSGAKVAEINMALDRYQGKDKEKATDWITVKMWSTEYQKLADTAQEYIKKGHLFGIVGELQQETWEDNGNKRSKIVVVARQLKLMQPKSGNTTPATTQEEAEDIFGAGTDEIPF